MGGSKDLRSRLIRQGSAGLVTARVSRSAQGQENLPSPGRNPDQEQVYAEACWNSGLGLAALHSGLRGPQSSAAQVNLTRGFRWVLIVVWILTAVQLRSRLTPRPPDGSGPTEKARNSSGEPGRGTLARREPCQMAASLREGRGLEKKKIETRNHLRSFGLFLFTT